MIPLELEEERKQRKVEVQNFALAMLAVTICGLVNNFTYCIISGASQNLAKQFHTENQVTLLTSCMNVFCLIAAVTSGKVLTRLRFYTRVRIVIVMVIVAYLGVAAAAATTGQGGWAVAAAFSCVAGMAQVFGECTNVAFLASLPSALIGGWGAGTGLAGVLGGGSYILLTGPLGLSNSVVFLVVMPSVIAYLAAFHYLHGQATRGLEGVDLIKALGGASPAASEGQQARVAGETGEAPAGAAPMTCENVNAALRCSGSIMFNLVAVYCLEYFIYPGLDDRETLCASKEWYTIMWMVYNIGVTLSRLSVALFRIRHVWILTVFQAFNVIGWTLEVYTGAIRNAFPHEYGIYIMAAWMIMVGLCGGATYGNCMYLFNKQEGIREDLRELGINLGFVFSNMGITLSTLSFLLLDSTIMSRAVLYPNGCS